MTMKMAIRWNRFRMLRLVDGPKGSVEIPWCAQSTMKLPRFEPTSLSPSTTGDIERDDDDVVDNDGGDDNDDAISSSSCSVAVGGQISMMKIVLKLNWREKACWRDSRCNVDIWFLNWSVGLQPAEVGHHKSFQGEMLHLCHRRGWWFAWERKRWREAVSSPCNWIWIWYLDR